MPTQMQSSNQTYNSDFSNYYDCITGHKDYQAEVNVLIRFIRQTINHPYPRILDVGCGTGNHAALLAERDCDITAIDLSPDMIRIAGSKNAKVKFQCGNIADMSGTDFHFCYSLFNVINCLDSIETLVEFFRAIFPRLMPGGIFLVESWNPIAVIAAPPQAIERTYECGGETIFRKVVPQPDFLHQRLDLRYNITVHTIAKQVKKSFSVIHRLVLFTPLEIEHCLRRAGFKDIKIYTALPEMAEATANDRMLAFACKKPTSP